ncbi:MAG: hypothetical protein K8W52_25515 [Deltaproteobacteria bacterium]|nr:hypothetical protein [Deltaproteobacteria bacterium]
MTRMIVASAVLVSVAACGGIGGSGSGSVCATSDDCGGDVCARTHECYPADEVRRVMTRWTLNAAPASAAQCTTDGIDHLSIVYQDSSTGEQVGYAPVPCGQGQFLVDVWPTRFDLVQLEAVAPGQGTIAIGANNVGRTGDVDTTIDLAIPALTP